MTQATLPGMRARKWGRVINLTSVAAQAGSVMAVHYAAAKAGVIAMTKSYARLLAKEGVTVNAISPALIGTEMVASNPHMKPDMIPVGRFGRVEECADVAVLLARNAYITGQTISVNGGMHAACEHPPARRRRGVACARSRSSGATPSRSWPRDAIVDYLEAARAGAFSRARSRERPARAVTRRRSPVRDRRRLLDGQRGVGAG